MVIEYNNNKYEVEIIKKNNKNIYIRIKDNKIIVTCNYFTTKREIEKLIKTNYNSITKMIDKVNIKKEKEDNFYLFGTKYDIIYGFSDINISDNKIYIKDNKTLNKYLDNKIKEVFTNRLDFWYNIFNENIPVPNLKIRKMTSRWGVCNLKNKNVTLNYYLYKYDLDCLYIQIIVKVFGI